VVEALKREITGPSSERLVDPNALPIPEPPKPDAPAGPGAATSSAPAAEEQGRPGATNAEGKGGKKLNWKNRTKNRRRDISEMDELETHVDECMVQDRSCPCGCGAQAVTMNVEVSWRLERIPAKLYRVKTVRETVAFPGHRQRAPDVPPPVVAAPPNVSYALPKAMCGNHLLADVVVDKYADHLPLYRQSERFQREGIDLPRSTLDGWMMQLAPLLKPIVLHLARGLLAGTWLRADATFMPVLDETKTRGKAHHGHLWAWGNYDTVVFSYTDNKQAPTVACLFPGFKGVVLIDGATDFNLLEEREGVERAGCWAHARRLFYKALAHDAKRALVALAAIRRLFLAERVVMAAPVEQRLSLRDELCRPVLDGLRKWVDEELQKVAPRTPIHKAIQYLDNQWQRLLVFLRKAEIACHNNDSERDLRRPVKGRDNYLFAGSPNGAQAAAIYYTLVGTCLLQGIDPRRYFVEIFGRFHEPPSHLTPQAIREQWEAAAKAAPAA
jgi:transposase